MCSYFISLLISLNAIKNKIFDDFIHFRGLLLTEQFFMLDILLDNFRASHNFINSSTKTLLMLLDQRKIQKTFVL